MKNSCINRPRFSTHEEGQTIVLLVLLLVGLFGVAALAIDGGIILTERRRAQAAADAAALSSALSGSSGEDWHAAGLAQANDNGFDNDGVEDIVEIYNPPNSGLYAPPYPNSNWYYQAIITVTSDPVFSQFVFEGDLTNTVEAVARAVSSQNVFQGNALHATSPDECKALWFSGNITTSITGGNAFSNSMADGSYGGAHCLSGVEDSASGSLAVYEGGIQTVGAWAQHDPSSVYSEYGVQTGVDPEPLPPVPTPDCSDLPTLSYSGGDATLDPGVYPGGIQVTANSDITLNPGLYCIGTRFKAVAGSIYGDGVMIYMQSGDYDVAGNVTINLTRPYDLIDASGNQWAGMMIYMDPSNTGQILISGNSGSSYSGTIYAPDPASPSSKEKCMFTGSSADVAINSQVICYSVKTTGNADLHIVYNAGDNFNLPPKIELIQ